MENNDSVELDAVNGLVDSQRVAEFLGVPRGTLRSWAKRKGDGIPGVHMSFPDPRPEQLGGTVLWDADDIRAFKETYDAATQSRKKGKNKDATNTLHAVESKHEEDNRTTDDVQRGNVGGAE